MRSFLLGLIIGVSATLGALIYYGYLDLTGTGSTFSDGSVAEMAAPEADDPPQVGQTFTQDLNPVESKSGVVPCLFLDRACRATLSDERKRRGLSGSARINANSHLVVHDIKNKSKHDDKNRLGVVTNLEDNSLRYSKVEIDPKAWQRKKYQYSDGTEVPAERQIASDLESACRLDNKANEFLVAEGGRTDIAKKPNGADQYVIERRPWLGRIFHIRLERSGSDYTAEILKTPALNLPALSMKGNLTDFVFELPTGEVKSPRSDEDYEGMACILLNPKDEAGKEKYLVVVGDRGGEPTRTSTLRWGVYDTNPSVSEPQIDWATTEISGIKAPGMDRDDDIKWRDVSGLHIDDERRLFATAAYDTDSDEPPYGSIVYQLGVICLGKPQVYGSENKNLCEAVKEPAPAVLDQSDMVFKSVKYHKLETVAGPSGNNPYQSMSVGAENEDKGGVWWLQIDANLTRKCVRHKNMHVIRVEHDGWNDSIDCIYQINLGEVNEGIVQSQKVLGVCEPSGGVWVGDNDVISQKQTCTRGCSFVCKPPKEG